MWGMVIFWRVVGLREGTHPKFLKLVQPEAPIRLVCKAVHGVAWLALPTSNSLFPSRAPTARTVPQPALCTFCTFLHHSDFRPYSSSISKIFFSPSPMSMDVPESHHSFSFPTACFLPSKLSHSTSSYDRSARQAQTVDCSLESALTLVLT